MSLADALQQPDGGRKSRRKGSDLSDRTRRQALLELSIEALESVEGLAIVSAVVRQDAQEMVVIRADVSSAHSAETVQAMIRRAWQMLIVRGRTSLHVIRQVPEGFEFRFAVLDLGGYLTGVFEVHLKAVAG